MDLFPPPAPDRVGFLAKDPWHPAIRRERMIARELVRRGSQVRFVQAPADVRRVRSDPRNWWAHLGRARFRSVAQGVAVTERSTLQPGLRSGLAERIDAGLLGSLLRRSAWDADLSVFMLPWEWRAARQLGGTRVFDCTDDWARVLPHARGLRAQLHRIADEAVRGAREMAEAMVAAPEEPVGCAKERVDWAAERTWQRRTDAWLDAVGSRRPESVTGGATS